MDSQLSEWLCISSLAMALSLNPVSIGLLTAKDLTPLTKSNYLTCRHKSGHVQTVALHENTVPTHSPDRKTNILCCTSQKFNPALLLLQQNVFKKPDALAEDLYANVCFW